MGQLNLFIISLLRTYLSDFPFTPTSHLPIPLVFCFSLSSLPFPLTWIPALPLTFPLTFSIPSIYFSPSLCLLPPFFYLSCEFVLTSIYSTFHLYILQNCFYVLCCSRFPSVHKVIVFLGHRVRIIIFSQNDVVTSIVKSIRVQSGLLMYLGVRGAAVIQQLTSGFSVNSSWIPGFKYAAVNVLLVNFICSWLW